MSLKRPEITITTRCNAHRIMLQLFTVDLAEALSFPKLSKTRQKCHFDLQIRRPETLKFSMEKKFIKSVWIKVCAPLGEL